MAAVRKVVQGQEQPMTWVRGRQATLLASGSWGLQALGPLAFMACRPPSAQPLCAWNKGAFFWGG
jgi:hypothetical protein